MSYTKKSNANFDSGVPLVAVEPIAEIVLACVGMACWRCAGHKSSASQQRRRNDRCKKASPDLFSADRFLSTSYTASGAMNFGASTLVASGLERARSPTWPFPLRSRFRCWCASSQRFSGGPALTVCRARKLMAIFAEILRHGFLMPHDHEARQSAGAHRMVFADLDPAAVTHRRRRRASSNC